MDPRRLEPDPSSAQIHAKGHQTGLHFNLDYDGERQECEAQPTLA
jgi:hypothetical protein